jgi:hypothetical protein
MLLRDIELPSLKKSTTDRENKEPSLATPITARVDPIRAILLRDNDEPTWELS